MAEMLRMIERQVLPALMVGIIECQGASVFAEEVPLSNGGVQDNEKDKTVYQEFGEAYRLFEKAVDETTDEQLLEAEIIDTVEDAPGARMALKGALPLLWRGYGEKDWKIRQRTYAVVRLDILLDGGKLFFTLKNQEHMKRFGNKNYKRVVDKFMSNVWRYTGLPMAEVSEKKNANCFVTLFPPSSQEERYGRGWRPASSFTTEPGKIHLPVHPVEDAVDPQDETAQIKEFTRDGLVAETAVHEFMHVLGLGHDRNPNDIMSTLPNRVEGINLINPTTLPPAHDLLYLPRLNQYLAISYFRLAEKSRSLKLVRWLRWLALKGALKGLLEKAEELAVERPVTNKMSQ